MDRADLIQKLQQGVWNITFTKVDGTERTMPCTLDPSLIPVVPISEDRKPKKTNDAVIKVFVTDVKEWRSFRIANLISIVQ